MIGEQETIFKILLAEDIECLALSGEIPMTEDILTNILIKVQNYDLLELWKDLLIRYEDTFNNWVDHINGITTSDEKIQEIKDKAFQYLTENIPGFEV